jgi:hypothetical protein
VLRPVGELRDRAGSIEIGQAIAHVRLRALDSRVVDAGRDLGEKEVEQQAGLQLADQAVTRPPTTQSEPAGAASCGMVGPGVHYGAVRIAAQNQQG